MRRQDSDLADDNDEEESNDELTLADAVSNYSRNRWNNFKAGFTEFSDIFRAAGRGIRSLFAVDDNDD